MIYLQYVYQKSGLTEPASISLEIHAAALRTEAMDEFQSAFPRSTVTLFPAKADLPILLYYRNNDNLLRRIILGYKNMSRTGVGFLRVDDRQFEVIPRASYLIWACREILIITLSGVFRLKFVGKFFLRLVDRILWLKESF
jgi:hypothetical protein